MSNNLIRYFNEVLGTNVQLSNTDEHILSKLPYYLTSNYKFYEGKIRGRNFIFVDQKGIEKLTSGQYRQHMDTIENTLKLPPVLVINNLESFNRKRLIERGVRFIEPGKQIFLPDFYTDIREFGGAPKKYIKKFSPSTQCILFYHILKKKKIDGLMYSDLASIFNYSKMTIGRSINELCETGSAKMSRGKYKKISLIGNKRELWERSLIYLETPVRESLFVDQLPDLRNCYITNLNALAHYTSISEDKKREYAMYKNFYFRKSNRIKDFRENQSEGNCLLQIWKYAPNTLAEGKYVDPLSLYMMLSENNEDRIQIELKLLLNKYIENE